jgi:YHS domain-containing protein
MPAAMQRQNSIMKRKYVFVIAALLSIAIFAAACSTTDDFAVVNTGADGLAVRGFDAVAYFTTESAVKGDPKFSFVWNGVKWYFSSEANMDKFKTNPEAYAPQFGGYCSYAVSHGYTADGDPRQWKIVDGKLYLNYNQKAKEAWEAAQEKLINDGEKNWREFRSKKPQHKG